MASISEILEHGTAAQKISLMGALAAGGVNVSLAARGLYDTIKDRPSTGLVRLVEKNPILGVLPVAASMGLNAAVGNFDDWSINRDEE